MKQLWDSHGTKILGVLIAVLGVVVGLDATQGGAIFGPMWQFVLTTASGLLVILRGFVNTANIKATVASGDTPV